MATTRPALRDSATIVEAAEACFVRWGIARTRMEDIAREAGISRPTIYHHFAGKEALIVAVIVRRIGIGSEQLRAEVPIEGSADDVLLKALILAVQHPGRKALSEGDDSGMLSSIIASSAEIDAAMAQFWYPYLHYTEARGELKAGLSIDEAAQWLTFIVFIYTTHPNLLPPPDKLEHYLKTFVVAPVASGNRLTTVPN